MVTTFETGALVAIHVADDPSAWVAAGFAIQGHALVLDGVAIVLHGSSRETRGIIGWTLHGITMDLDGLTTLSTDGVQQGATAVEHPNRVSSIDHVVVQTNDFSRTLPELERAGLELRRTRTFDFGDIEQQQCFFWLGTTILELVGPSVPTPDAKGPATFWGLALTSPDLEATVTSLGDRTTPLKPAVQRDRFISTLKTRDLDISLPVALMSPHVPRGSATVS